MTGRTPRARTARLCAGLVVPLLALAAVPTVAQVTVSITSTPANGTHYLVGETITTRLSGIAIAQALALQRISDCRERHPTETDRWSWRCNWMRIDIGGVTREAWTVTNPLGTTTIDYEYTVLADDSDSDGISIPENSIVGKSWRTSTFGPLINRNHAALPDQPAHRVRVAAGEPGSEAPEPQEPNQAPQVAEAPGAVELDPGGTAEVALSGTFQDPEGDPLEFSAASSRPAVAITGIDGDMLTVTAVAEGQARITVRGTDPFGAFASVSFLVTVGNPVSIGGAGDAAGMVAAGSAPEGGVAEVAVTMAEPREEDVSFDYSLGPDSDPATADADAADHGDEGGTVTIPAGETEATIRIPIADDDDIEPAREAFVVELQPSDGAGLASASAVVHVEEGVCDRTWQVADALRGGRACAAVTPADLERRRVVRLTEAGLAELDPLDFHGLAGLRVLILDGNGLSALPEGLLAGSPGLRVLRLRGNRFEMLPTLGSAPALIELDLAGNLLTALPASPFANLPSLRYLYMGGNGIDALPADLLADADSLRFLELQDNALESLPAGIFAGVARLFSLQLQGNPGAPFSLPVELAVEADAAAEGEGEGGADEGSGEGGADAGGADEGEDEEEPGRATIQLRVPHAAPFAISAEISATGATLSVQTATIAPGETLGEPVSVVRNAAGDEADATATVEITSVSSLPVTACGDDFDEYRCFGGFELTSGSPLTLFEPPATADVPTMR